jgi:hypothetical protein
VTKPKKLRSSALGLGDSWSYLGLKTANLVLFSCYVGSGSSKKNPRSWRRTRAVSVSSVSLKTACFHRGRVERLFHFHQKINQNQLQRYFSVSNQSHRNHIYLLLLLQVSPIHIHMRLIGREFHLRSSAILILLLKHSNSAMKLHLLLFLSATCNVVSAGAGSPEPGSGTGGLLKPTSRTATNLQGEKRLCRHHMCTSLFRQHGSGLVRI